MQDTVCFITTDSLGQGDHELGQKLMSNYLRLLSECASVPVAIFLMNAGVRLSCSGSQVLASLRILQERGTEILSCQTCINTYNLQKEVQVGLVAGMADFLELAGKYKVFTVA
jgi:intracellular sulfur oxidation DsrE/DsrF family protein